MFPNIIICQMTHHDCWMWNQPSRGKKKKKKKRLSVWLQIWETWNRDWIHRNRSNVCLCVAQRVCFYYAGRKFWNWIMFSAVQMLAGCFTTFMLLILNEKETFTLDWMQSVCLSCRVLSASSWVSASFFCCRYFIHEVEEKDSRHKWRLSVKGHGAEGEEH